MHLHLPISIHIAALGRTIGLPTFYAGLSSRAFNFVRVASSASVKECGLASAKRRVKMEALTQWTFSSVAWRLHHLIWPRTSSCRFKYQLFTSRRWGLRRTPRCRLDWWCSASSNFAEWRLRIRLYGPALYIFSWIAQYVWITSWTILCHIWWQEEDIKVYNCHRTQSTIWSFLSSVISKLATKEQA